MYWFRRPPYLRWLAAALLLITATWLDLRPEPTVLRPFAAVDLPAGTVVEATQLEWREVPAGIWPDPGDPTGTISRRIAAGEPVVPSAVSGDRAVAPEGWWTLETRLPQGAYPGQAVHLILLPTEMGANPQSIPGVVISPAAQDDPLAFEDLPGLVAVPGESAAIAAAAVAESSVAVILGG